MRRKLIRIALILHVSSCLLFSTLLWNGERNPPLTDGLAHDGRSSSTPILVEAKAEHVGVNTEYLWMAYHYPSCRIVSQSLAFEGRRAYDILAVVERDATSEEAYFDITSFH